jgi:hypothetical protein
VDAAAAGAGAAPLLPSHLVEPSGGVLALAPPEAPAGAEGAEGEAASRKKGALFGSSKARKAAAAVAAAKARWPANLPPTLPSRAWVRPFAGVELVVSGRVVTHHEDSEKRCAVSGTLALPSPLEALQGAGAAAWAWGDDGERRLRAHPMFAFRVQKVLTDVLSNRLYRKLRDGLGTCYDARASWDADFFSRFCALNISCTPLTREVAPAVAQMLATVAAFALGREPLTRKEFEEAVRPIRAQRSSDLKTNSYWTGALLSLHSHGSLASAAGFRDVERFWAALAFEDALAGAEAVAEALRARGPLAVHLVVGISGGVSFVAGGGVRAKGAAPKLLKARRRGAAAAAADERAEVDEEREWASLVAQISGEQLE